MNPLKVGVRWQYRHVPGFKSFRLTGTERTKDLNRGLPPPAPIQCSISRERLSLVLPVDAFNNAAKLFPFEGRLTWSIKLVLGTGLANVCH